MRLARRLVAILLAAGVLLFLPFEGYRLVTERPQDLPWTRLDLRLPIGAFTGRKLAGLTHDFPRCRRLLGEAGVRYQRLPPIAEGEGGACGYADGVRRTGSRRIAYLPREPGTSCAVAAALAVWEREIVQPAAERHFGRRTRAIEHLGSYACRRMVGRYSGNMSQHATADAIDIAGFRLDNGARISVKADWPGVGPKARFLREVRSGGCRLFATVLSPDYNAAHADHLHLDEAAWGEFGWRGCH